MSRDLTNLFIDETFQYLTQISGSNRDILEDGLGNRITELDITASNSISSSHSVTAVSSSYSVTSSYALDNYTAATNTFSDITLTKGDGTTTILDTTPNQMVEKIINRNGFMPKGTPVYVSGSTGDQLNVYAADAGDPNKMPAVYILAQDLDPDEEGLGILSGEIIQVNTSAFEDGDEIWVAVGGGYTNQRPTGSNTLVQKLGAVVKAQTNGSGVIFGAGRANDVPNIQEGYAWVGDVDGVAQPIPTSSLRGDSFPYTGSALITGSLGVTGSISAQGPLGGKFTYTNNLNGGFRTNEIDFTGQDLTQFRSDDTIAFDNTYFGAGTGSMSFNTNGNMSFNTYAGGDISINPTNASTNINGNFKVNITDTGSQEMRVGTNNEFLLMGISGYEGGGGFVSTANMLFGGADQAFFSAQNEFYIKNVFNDTGSITVWSENALTLRGDTSVEIFGGDPFVSSDPQEQINITGKAFATSIASNINGFSTTISQDSTVREFVRAFVETPMQVDNGKTITVETGATLKVINEL